MSEVLILLLKSSIPQHFGHELDLSVLQIQKSGSLKGDPEEFREHPGVILIGKHMARFDLDGGQAERGLDAVI